MAHNSIKEKGFALLYSILLAGAVLAIGVILMNIITKQLVYSSLNNQSELAYYYDANSGRECLQHYADKYPSTATEYVNGPFYKRTGPATFDFSPEVTFNCFEQPVTMTQTPVGGNKVSYTATPVNLPDKSKIEMTVTFNKDCLAHLPACTGTALEDKNRVVMKATGSSGAIGSDRSTRRVAIAIKSN